MRATSTPRTGRVSSYTYSGTRGGCEEEEMDQEKIASIQLHYFEL